MSRRLLGAILTGLLIVGLGACGIPDQTPVTVDGRGPGRGDGTDGQVEQPPARTDSHDPGQFALDYLSAAAGEIGSAYERARAYVTPASRVLLPEQHGEDAGINIVRLTETPPVTAEQDGTYTVILTVQHVGVLRANGAVDPPELKKSEYVLKIGRAADVEGSDSTEGLFVLNPPPVLLMTTQALKNYYWSRTIYFWNKDRTSLVPDLRYLPLAVPQGRRATEVLGWLIDGPADWLSQAAAGLPAGSSMIGNVTQTHGGRRLEVNLSLGSGPSSQAAEAQRLAVQLAWSLGGLDRTTDIELQIKDEPVGSAFNAADHRREHPAYRVSERPEAFCVYDGAVHRLSMADDAQAPVPLAAALNRNVASAAFHAGNSSVAAAVVTADGGHRQLRVGSGVGTVKTLVRTGGAQTQMSRPVWLNASDPGDPVGLIAAGGRLYRFGLDGLFAKLDIVGVPAKVTAVAASVDGHRIALIADGTLYVVALSTDGQRVTAGPPRKLVTSLHELSAVDWSGEGWLVVAGVADKQAALYDVTVDGAVERPRRRELGNAKITHLAAYPDNPVGSAGARVMYEQNGLTFDETDATKAPVQLGPSRVASLPGTTPSGDSGTPAAPFFLF